MNEISIKQYLRQTYRLDQAINSDLEEVASLREMASTVSSPQLGERVQTSKKNEAPFIKCIEKIMVLESKINEEIDLLVELKSQIRSVIMLVDDKDERMVLKYRYIHNYTWDRIAEELNADSRTVRRWHDRALNHISLPDDPITI